MKVLLPVCLILGISFAAKSQDTIQNSFGDGLYYGVAKDSSYSVKISARFQGLFESEWINSNGEIYDTGSGLSIRRARLKAEGFAFSPRVTYKLQIGLSNSDIDGASPFNGNTANLIKDAYVAWNFIGGFTLLAGQAKLPGNRSQLISSSSLQFVDRSEVDDFFNLGRETGLQLEHEHKIGEIFLRETVAFSQGEGANITEGNIGGFSYTGRVEVMPFGKFEDDGAYSGGDLQREKNPKLALAAAWNFNDNAVRTRGNRGEYMLRSIDPFESDVETWFFDAIFKWQGLSLMGEYAMRNTDAESLVETRPDDILIYTLPSGAGWSVQAGYLLPSDIEFAFRYTQMDIERTVLYPEAAYTLGLSKYFAGHNLKVQTDMTLEQPDQSDVYQLLYRLQFELQF